MGYLVLRHAVWWLNIKGHYIPAAIGYAMFWYYWFIGSCVPIEKPSVLWTSNMSAHRWQICCRPIVRACSRMFAPSIVSSIRCENWVWQYWIYYLVTWNYVQLIHEYGATCRYIDQPTDNSVHFSIRTLELPPKTHRNEARHAINSAFAELREQELNALNIPASE